MNIPERDQKSDAPVGFAGMIHMVSDVDALLREAGRQPNPTVPPQVAHSPDFPSPPGQKTEVREAQPVILRPSVPGSEYGSYGWAIGALVILTFGSIIYSAWNNESRSIVSTSTPPAPSRPNAPAPSSEQRPAPSYQEEKPPVGTNMVLSLPQIRYCLAEKIRLDAAQPLLHDTDDVRSVTQFNDLIDDYNRRCAEFRYSRPTMEVAKADVEQRRATIHAAGIERITRASDKLERSPAGRKVSQNTESASRFIVESPPAIDTAPASRASARDAGETLEQCPHGSSAEICLGKNGPTRETDEEAEARIANLKQCLDGRYPALCNHRELTAAQSKEVDAAERAANLKQCLTGDAPFFCDHTRLSADQEKAVEAAERRAMFAVCVEGRYPALCQEALLTPEQQQMLRTVRAAAQSGEGVQ